MNQDGPSEKDQNPKAKRSRAGLRLGSGSLHSTGLAGSHLKLNDFHMPTPVCGNHPYQSSLSQKRQVPPLLLGKKNDPLPFHLRPRKSKLRSPSPFHTPAG